MIQYTISCFQPNLKWLEVRMIISDINQDSFMLQLPSWRPGRYELSNFAKNINHFKVTANGQSVSFQKVTKDCWEIKNEKNTTVEISYSYYAVDWNAGSTYVTNEFIYVNPVNCLMFRPDKMKETSQVQLIVPKNYELACGASFEKNKEGYLIRCNDFHELADSPFICGTTLQSKSYTSHGHTFHIWFNGVCKPDWKKIIGDFKKFTDRQIQSFEKFTCKEYHFLIHALPFTFYHGVEHLTTSVNALGPGYAIMEERYVDLLGLCSHELYHTWNIKSIRPAEMYPYRYNEENYFRTGYVAEGVTTYMGDIMLYASDVFDQSQFLKEMNVQIQKHMDNGGRLNYSVAESSFDTWLDGYVPGIPDRKVSIYTEGCLAALLCDIYILEGSKGKFTLDNVMKDLYHDYALKGKGYAEEDYRSLVKKYAGRDLPEVFDDLLYGTGNYLNALQKALSYIEMEILSNANSNYCERVFGFKILESPEKSMVMQIWHDAPAAQVLAVNDQIIAINNLQVKGDVNRWLNLFSGEEVTVTVLRSGEKVEVKLKPDGKEYYANYYFSPKTNFPNELAKRWKGRNEY